MQSQFSQCAAEMQSKRSQNVVKMQSKCSQVSIVFKDFIKNQKPKKIIKYHYKKTSLEKYPFSTTSFPRNEVEKWQFEDAHLWSAAPLKKSIDIIG